MTVHNFRIATLAGVIAAALAAPALAQGVQSSTIPEPAPVVVTAPAPIAPATMSAQQSIDQHPQAPLQPKQQGDITFITGGIGDSEVDQLKAQEANYNFQMINSDPTGHYTADTDLVIQSKDGREMIRVNDAGPLFYAQLPPGVYTVEATHDGRSERKTVRISAHGGPAKAVMIWR